MCGPLFIKLPAEHERTRTIKHRLERFAATKPSFLVLIRIGKKKSPSATFSSGLPLCRSELLEEGFSCSLVHLHVVLYLNLLGFSSPHASGCLVRQPTLYNKGEKRHSPT